MASDRRCPHCASDTPGRHYRDLCPGDASLRPLFRDAVLGIKRPDGVEPLRGVRVTPELLEAMRRGKR